MSHLEACKRDSPIRSLLVDPLLPTETNDSRCPYFGSEGSEMAMTTSELLRTLERGRQEKLARLNATPAQQPPSAQATCRLEEPKNEEEQAVPQVARRLGVMVGFSFFCVVLPLLVAHPPLGKTVLLAIPPNLFITLSWMAGAWYTYDKNRQLGHGSDGWDDACPAGFLRCLDLAGELRSGFEHGSSAGGHDGFLGSSSLCPRFAMLVSFTNNLQRTSEIEPEGEDRACPSS